MHWLYNGNDWASHGLGPTDEDTMFIGIGDREGDGYADIEVPENFGRAKSVPRQPSPW